MEKTKILIVDDHRMIIDGITGLLQDDYEISCASSAEQMTLLLSQHRFDLALLDLQLGDGSLTLDLMARIKETGAKVIIMSGAATDDMLSACISHGAGGFIDKHLGSQEVIPAVQGVLAGHLVFPAGLLAKLLNGNATSIPKISEREKDVLNLLFLFPGMTNETIADILSRSVGRVRNIATALFQKFEVLDRHELVSKAQKCGYYPSQGAQRELLILKARSEQRSEQRNEQRNANPPA
jgi:DNA-binding NarL/FixJ family response regulator